MLMMEKCQHNGKYYNIQALFNLKSVLEERGQCDTGKLEYCFLCIVLKQRGAIHDILSITGLRS